MPCVRTSSLLRQNILLYAHTILYLFICGHLYRFHLWAAVYKTAMSTRIPMSIGVPALISFGLYPLPRNTNHSFDSVKSLQYSWSLPRFCLFSLTVPHVLDSCITNSGLFIKILFPFDDSIETKTQGWSLKEGIFPQFISDNHKLKWAPFPTFPQQ